MQSLFTMSSHLLGEKIMSTLLRVIVIAGVITLVKKLLASTQEESNSTSSPTVSTERSKSNLNQTTANETVTITETFVPETPCANIYLDFYRNADDSSDKFGRVYPGLRTQLEKLRRKHGNALFPSFQDGDDIVEFFRDRFFPNDRRQTLLVSNLTLVNRPKDVTLLVRHEMLLPSMETEVPSGLTIAIKVHYKIKLVGKTPQSSRDNTSPLLIVKEIIDMSHCAKRDFEQKMTATVFSAYSQDDYRTGVNRISLWNNNVVSPDFVEQLQKISLITQDNLSKWNDYLNFCEEYTRFRFDGLRFVESQFVDGRYRFLVVAESADMFNKHSKFLHNDDVQAFPIEYSSEPWTFKLNEEKHYLKSVKLGDRIRPAGKQLQQNVVLPKELQGETGWKEPYCVWVEFKLSEEQQESYDAWLAKTSTEDLTKHNATFMKPIPQHGWLSTSAHGDFALIQRLRNQLKTLQEQGGYAPYLSSYLFDIKKARQPQAHVEITDWMNPNLNEDQKNAVRKMLAAPDIGFIQGPPGTGKTTVIAELIYQLVKRGKTVGLFSQANLAVDNVLERLVLTPIIRAVRLGKKAETDCRYHQENTLATYYKAIAERCSKNTLDNWTERERQIESLTDWLHETEILFQDVNRLNEARVHAETDYEREEVDKEFSCKRKQLRELINQQSETSKVADYPLLRETVEKQLQNTQTQYESLRPVIEAWTDILKDWTADIVKQETVQHDKSSFTNEEYLRSCNVVGVSCTENSRTLLDAGHPHFDIVIVDEVSKATPLELMIPMLLGKTAILVGDHKQLPPMFAQKGAPFEELVSEQEETERHDNMLTKDNLKRFEKMVTSSWFKEQFEKASESLKVSLWKQYRMSRGIMRCVNLFYGGRLECGLEHPEVERQHGLTLTGERGRSILTPQQDVIGIDSSTLPNGRPNYEENTGTVNKLEAIIIAKMLMKLDQECRKQGYTPDNPKHVAVITFYGKQLREIRNAIRKAGNFTAIKVVINTVDKFQGQERPIVIVSMVR